MSRLPIDQNSGPITSGVTTHRPAPDPAIDWRFLLPSTSLGRVAIVGPRLIDLEEAVESCADSVTRISGLGDHGRFDTVLCRGDNLAQVRLALSLVRPSGSLRVHAPARPIRPRIRRLLVGAGCTVSTWWARPSAADARCLVALDDRAAAATAIRAVGDRGRRAPYETVLARSGIVRWTSTEVAILAVAPRADGARDTRSAVAAPNPDRPVTALVTPRYASSRTVVGVSTDASGNRIAHIAKLARAVADQSSLINESQMLDAFLSRSLDDHHVPAGHHLSLHAGSVVLVERAVDGDPLDRRRVRRDPPSAWRAGLSWLEQVPLAETVDGLGGDRFDDLITRPLDAIGIALSASGEADHPTDRARDLLDLLRGADLPVVFEHGDFSHPNLFVDRSGHLVVIDWERARPEGLPLHDALYFLAYLAESVDRPSDDASLIDAYRGAFAPSGWARPDLDLHLERLHIDPRRFMLLNLACWTRMFAQTLSSPPTARTRHRADRLWRAAIEDAMRCTR